MAFPIFHPFDVTIAAGTPKNAPVTTLTQFNAGIVDRIDWLFPDGCNGLVGIQIGARNVPVIPGQAGRFFIRSGDSSGYDLEDLPNTGDWSVIGYNTGAFDHIVHVTFRIRRIPSPPKYVFITDGLGTAIGIGEG
jgi:hypothetical protein